MRKILRLFVFNILSFGMVAYLIPAVNYSGNLEVLAKSAVIYALLSMFLKPLLSLLALPLNFVSFGLFSWLSNLILIYLVGRIEPLFKIESYQFPGLFYQGFVIPHFGLGSFQTAILVCFMIGFFLAFLLWLSD